MKTGKQLKKIVSDKIEEIKKTKESYPSADFSARGICSTQINALIWVLSQIES